MSILKLRKNDNSGVKYIIKFEQRFAKEINELGYDVDLLILDLLENMSLINDSDKVVQAIDFSGVQNKNMPKSILMLY